jgi:hypothetical protein
MIDEFQTLLSNSDERRKIHWQKSNVSMLARMIIHKSVVDKVSESYNRLSNATDALSEQISKCFPDVEKDYVKFWSFIHQIELHITGFWGISAFAFFFILEYCVLWLLSIVLPSALPQHLVLQGVCRSISNALLA